MPKEDNNITKKDIRAILERLDKIEKTVFLDIKAKTVLKKEVFVGATGGIRFLVSKRFLKTKRNLSEIRLALEKNGYHYSIQAAQTALNRLSKPGGLLVALKEKGRKVYAERK